MFYHLCRGTLPSRISELHAKYGKVVRVAPTELSFVAEEAWAPIYNKPTHRPQLQKDPSKWSTWVVGRVTERFNIRYSAVCKEYAGRRHVSGGK